MRVQLHVLTVDYDRQLVVVDIRVKSVVYSEDREAATWTIPLELFDQALIRDDVPTHEHVVEEGDVFRGFYNNDDSIDVMGRN